MPRSSTAQMRIVAVLFNGTNGGLLKRGEGESAEGGREKELSSRGKLSEVESKYDGFVTDLEFWGLALEETCRWGTKASGVDSIECEHGFLKEKRCRAVLADEDMEW